MTRFISNGDQDASKGCIKKGRIRKVPIKLIITGSSESYRWMYSSRFVHLDRCNPTEIDIEVLYETTDIDSAVITDYCSTGITKSYSPIQKFTPSVAGTSSVKGKPATLTILLTDHQMIDFGVFVELKKGKKLVTLFCDPQASNDPI